MKYKVKQPLQILELILQWESDDRMPWTEVYLLLQTFIQSECWSMEQLSQKTSALTFLNDIFRHYAFPILSKLNQSKTQNLYKVWTNQNILSNLYILSKLSQSEYSAH